MSNDTKVDAAATDQPAENTDSTTTTSPPGGDENTAVMANTTAPVVYLGLTILSPRQRNTGATDAMVVLPQARTTMLNDEDDNDKEIKKATTTTDDVVHNSAILSTVPSPFTGPDAVVSLPGSLQSLADARRPHILDDYGDLTPLADMIHDKSKFRIVLERYNGATVRDHVQRTRALLDGNAPFVTSLMEAGGGENKKETEGTDGPDKPAGTEGDDPKDGAAASPTDGPEKEGEDGAAAGTDKEAPTAPAPETGKIEMDPTQLQDFFALACGEESMTPLPSSSSNGADGGNDNEKSKRKGGKKKKKNNNQNKKDSSDTATPSPAEAAMRLQESDQLVRVDCTVEYSGFHPPPPRRRLLRDLAYLEVTAPDKSVLHVTACPTGFYINNSTSSSSSSEPVFNPSPHPTTPCFAHALLDCLVKASPSIETAWKTALDAARERSELSTQLGDNAVQSLLRMAQQPSKLDAVLMCPYSLLVAMPRKWKPIARRMVPIGLTIAHMCTARRAVRKTCAARMVWTFVVECSGTGMRNCKVEEKCRLGRCWNVLNGPGEDVMVLMNECLLLYGFHHRLQQIQSIPSHSHSLSHTHIRSLLHQNYLQGHARLWRCGPVRHQGHRGWLHRPHEPQRTDSVPCLPPQQHFLFPRSRLGH